jgi:hypothetical protein
LKDIDKNENSRILNDVKMALMDEIFMFYKKVCSTINTQALAEYEKKTFAPPQLIEQSDVPTAPVKKARKPRAKKISKG